MSTQSFGIKYIQERSICLPKKPSKKMSNKPVYEALVDIVNTSYTGKQVIISLDGEWKHYWIPSKGKVTVPSRMQISSSLTEMVRRDQIQIVRR